MLSATSFNSKSLIAARFFLGATEAAIAPGLSIIVSMWYKRSEQPFRQGIWFQGITIAGIFGGLVAYGIGHLQTIAPWKVRMLMSMKHPSYFIETDIDKAVFLIFGAITIVWAAVLFFWLPDTPMNARFLSQEDRHKAIIRVQENMTGIKNDEFKLQQLIEALLDLKCWALALINLASSIPNGGVSNVSTQAKQDTAYN